MPLRAIKPIELPPGAVRAVDFGVKPKVLWVAPTDLYVDDEYQRDLNRRSIKLIIKICAGFAWAKVDPPVCVREGKKLHCIDGQHTAIAASTLGIPKMLVIEVVAAAGPERAEAFVSHNRDHLTMTQLDVYRAQLGGKNPDAVRVARVCGDAGVRLKTISYVVQPKVGDSAAITAISKLVAKRGPGDAGAVLSALVRAGRAPVSSAEIVAAEEFVHGDDQATATQLYQVAKALGPEGLLKCYGRATTERISAKIAILDAYRRLLARKRKGAS